MRIHIAHTLRDKWMLNAYEDASERKDCSYNVTPIRYTSSTSATQALQLCSSTPRNNLDGCTPAAKWPPQRARAGRGDQLAPPSHTHSYSSGKTMTLPQLKSFANGADNISENDAIPSPLLPGGRSSWATVASQRSTTPSDPYHSSGLSTEWNTPSNVTCSAPSRCAYTRGTQESPALGTRTTTCRVDSKGENDSSHKKNTASPRQETFSRQHKEQDLIAHSNQQELSFQVKGKINWGSSRGPTVIY